MTNETLLEALKNKLGDLDERDRQTVDAVLKFLKTGSEAAIPAVAHSLFLKPTRFPNEFVGENLIAQEYLALSQDERFDLQCALLDLNADWLSRTFDELGAAWIIVVDGEVVAWSPEVDQYPQEAELLAVCQETGKFPFVFDDERLLQIEEASTALVGRRLFHLLQPTMTLNFAAQTTHVAF